MSDGSCLMESTWDNELVLSLTLMIFFSSLVLYFSKEIAKFLNFFGVIPGVKLVIPLAIVSWIILRYEFWVNWLLSRLQAVFDKTLNALASFLPYENVAILLLRILFLYSIANLPLWIYKLHARKKAHCIPPSISTHWMGLFLFILFSMLLSIF